MNDVLAELERLGDPKVKAIKAGFAITAENSHGIFLKDIKALAKRIGRNDGMQPDHGRERAIEIETVIARTRLVRGRRPVGGVGQ